MIPTSRHRGGSGEPMVLLHGFTANWQVWRRLLPALESEYDVFAPTVAGHYGGPAFDPGVAVSVPAMTDVIERQLDAEGIDRAHLVGNSLGGWIGLELAVRGRARTVTGICPAGGWENGSPEERSVVQAFQRAADGLRLSRRWFKTIAGRPRMRAIALRDAMARPRDLTPDEALSILEGAAGCAIVPEMLELGRRGEVFGELPRIECPVTIALSTADRLFSGPGHYEKLRRLLPYADWVTLEGLGHIPMTDDPDLVVKTIRDGAGRAAAIS